MQVIVGLRNPGSAYAGTRHNVGGEIVAAFAENQGAKLKRARLGIRADVAEIRVGEARAALAIPRSFMNESGQVVSPLLRYFRAEAGDLLVVHDDIDLPFGKMRVQFGRGAGGNNGVASVIKSLRSNEFWRFKFGVGRPPGRMDPADYVLKRFTSTERVEVDLLVSGAADTLGVYLEEGHDKARQRAGELTGKERQ